MNPTPTPPRPQRTPTLLYSATPTGQTVAMTVDMRGAISTAWRAMELRVDVPLYAVVIGVLLLYLFAFRSGLYFSAGKSKGKGD